MPIVGFPLLVLQLDCHSQYFVRTPFWYFKCDKFRGRGVKFHYNFKILTRVLMKSVLILSHSSYTL